MRFSIAFKIIGILIIIGAIVDFFHLHNDMGPIISQQLAIHEIHRQVDAQFMLVWFALGVVVTIAGIGFGKLENRVDHHQ